MHKDNFNATLGYLKQFGVASSSIDASVSSLNEILLFKNMKFDILQRSSPARSFTFLRCVFPFPCSRKRASPMEVMLNVLPPE